MILRATHRAAAQARTLWARQAPPRGRTAPARSDGPRLPSRGRGHHRRFVSASGSVCYASLDASVRPSLVVLFCGPSGAWHLVVPGAWGERRDGAGFERRCANDVRLIFRAVQIFYELVETYKVRSNSIYVPFWDPSWKATLPSIPSHPHFLDSPSHRHSYRFPHPLPAPFSAQSFSSPLCQTFPHLLPSSSLLAPMIRHP